MCAPGKGSSSHHTRRCIVGETTEQTSPGYVSSGNQKMDWIFSMDSENLTKDLDIFCRKIPCKQTEEETW